MAKGKYWIKGAIKRPGALRRKAKAAGASVKSYCVGKMKGSSTTARQCRLARTLRSLPRRGRRKR